MRQDREDGFTRRALNAPDGDPTQPDTRIMRMACPAPTATAGGLVLQLKAEGQEERHHQFEKRLAVIKQLHVGRFVLKIDNDGPVFSRRFGRCAHVSPLCRQVSSADGTR